jgi:phenylpropionate dioxygenase-like ring-hydroxylating dioxygenase large terminal subunit
MLSQADNEILCRVGPGTPMGEFMRQHWLPAVRSDELTAPGGPPLRVKLLGEELIAFRATSGDVGLIQNACPHRGASLFFGRNEEEGLRCVYHGWKFDVSGVCVDMPSEPTESNFKTKVRARAYPAQERGGIVWAYMGSRVTPPPLPEIEPNMLPEEEVLLETAHRSCNWMQAMEGDIDTSHLSFLHSGAESLENQRAGSFSYYAIKDKAPRYVVVETDFGTSYGAYRPAEPGFTYWRIAHFLYPCFSMIPTGILGKQVLARAWVPLDDENCMLWSMAGRAGSSMVGRAAAVFGHDEYLPNTTGWLGRSVGTGQLHNDYKIDREMQKSGNSFTGIPGVHEQDQCVTETMGPLYERDHEHLGTSDAMVIRTRRALIKAAKALHEEGTAPATVDNPGLYLTRSGGVILPNDADWLLATEHLRTAFTDHAGLTEAPVTQATE